MTPPIVRSWAPERAAHLIERQEWLDAPGYTLEHALGFALNLLGDRSRAVQDALQGLRAGHPLHPALTDVPLGVWTAAAVFDALDALSPGPARFRQPAQLSVGVGVIGGVAAAATGLADWQHTHDDARRLGMAHGALNTLAMALYGMSWRDRRRRRHVRAVTASTLGYAVVLASSYLGGTLVFRHRIGVDHSDPRLEPRSFTPVLADDELGVDTPTALTCEGVAVVLVRHAGQITAVGGECPHLGAPMAEGWLYRGELVCPWHGSRFALRTGAPSTGPATAPLPCFDTQVRAGMIEVRRVPPSQASAR